MKFYYFILNYFYKKINENSNINLKITKDMIKNNKAKKKSSNFFFIYYIY